MLQPWKTCIYAFLLATLATTAHAEDCMVSTDPPARLSTLPDVMQHTDKSGVYQVTFAGGDLILAKYGTCELALSAHYLLRTDASLKNIEDFLAAVVPAQGQAASLVQQLQEKGPLSSGQSVSLEGENDGHLLSIQPASSPLFKTVVHYRWQAPQH